MNQHIIFILLLSALLSPSEHQTELAEAIGTIPVENEQQMQSQKDLKQKFEAITKETVYDIFYMNEKDEEEKPAAFIFAGSQSFPQDPSVFCGSFWYIDEQECTLLMDNIESSRYEPVVLENKASKHLMFVVCSTLPGSSTTYIWRVQDHRPDLIFQADAHCFMDRGGIAAVKSFISNSAGGIRIWQRYYIYWDEQKQSYEEYIGRPMTREEFLTYENAEEMQERVQEAIRKQIPRDYTIDKIDVSYLKRDNGIININYHYVSGESSFYYYAMLPSAEGIIELADPTDDNLYERGYINEKRGF